jgi:RNA polymerase sigma-70 factor (ECF subfamily)
VTGTVTEEQEVQSAQWMRLAQAGDQDAYAQLLALLTSVTRHYARGKSGAVPWVEDVVQETLISVHKARHTYDSARPFAPWFYAIAAHRVIDVYRRERRVASREQGSDELPEPATVRTVERAGDIDMDKVRAALASLPARQRDIIEGLKLRDESVRALASRLGMSESAVKVTAHRGYLALKKILGVKAS